MKAIVNGKVISQGRILTDHALVFDQQIRAICPLPELNSWSASELIDAQGLFVAPGFIDIHIHGCGGYDTMDATTGALRAMGQCLAEHGVTAFLPTTMSAPWEKIRQVVGVVRRIAGENGLTLLQKTGEDTQVATRVLGVHLEGPFLNSAFKGAQAAEHLTLPDFALLTDYLDIIRIITLAPELPGTDALLDQLAAYPQIVPAIGHSGASFEATQWAIEGGVRHATHLFNAMSRLHHRQPGVVGAVLASGICAELIADNLHVHPGLYDLLLKTQGLERLILVSDAMRAAGLSDGEYELGGQTVRVQSGAARLADGTLAGSVLTLDKAVANFRQATGCGLAEAIGLVTRNPAKLLGLGHRIGDLRVGMEADIVVLDEGCNIVEVFVRGLGGTLLRCPAHKKVTAGRLHLA